MSHIIHGRLEPGDLICEFPHIAGSGKVDEMQRTSGQPLDTVTNVGFRVDPSRDHTPAAREM
jgi:hypothetical protein